MRAVDNDDPARRFLESALSAELEARRRKERADELERKAERLTAQLSAAPRGGGSDHQEMLAILADARTLELEAMREAEKQRKRVETFIARIESPVQRAILVYRYLSFCGWRTVQKKLREAGLYYSDRQITRLHGAALGSARTLWGADHAEGHKEETGDA